MSKRKEKQLKKEMEAKERKAQIFNDFYEEVYGPERWPSLLAAMKSPQRHCCLINGYATSEGAAEHLAMVTSPERISFVDLICYSSLERFPHPSKDSRNCATYYLLDAASVMAAQALAVEANDHVLDLCAAPGGKTVAILQKLSLQSGGHLTANEISQSRRRRLRQVIIDYLPPELRQYIQITGQDGTMWNHVDQYDKVLLDAPCSSERHLLQDEMEFLQWTPKRTRNCAVRQYALLCAAVRSVKEDGGRVVYSTCSISPKENDDVIEKYLRKGKIKVEVEEKQHWPIGEKTKYGWIVLPDIADNWGPIYFAVLRRVVFAAPGSGGGVADGHPSHHHCDGSSGEDNGFDDLNSNNDSDHNRG